MRKYSVDELDRMRAALIERHPIREVSFATLGMGESEPTEETYRRRHEMSARVEDELRTHMLNGTNPDELDVPTKED